MNRYKLLIGVIIITIIIIIIIGKLILYFSPISNHQPFKNIWTETTDEGKSYKEVVKEILKKTIKISRAHNIELVAIDGTLLGIERHEGLIPWDYDLDFAISKDMWDNLLSLKDEFAKANLGIIQYSPTLIKIYNTSYPLIEGTTWAWPFIDIFHYISEGEHVVIDEPGMKNCFLKMCDIFRTSSKKILLEDFFPFRTKFFEGISVNTPNNVDKILEDEYGNDWKTVCISSNYNHRKEKAMEGGMRVPCKSVLHKVDDSIFDNIWIINLDNRPDRLKQTKNRLNNFGLISRRWSAVDKKSSSFKKLYTNINTNRTSGEVACYYSHLKLWRHIYNSGVSHAIIFEDDIYIPPTLTLEKVKNVIADSVGFNILLLGYCGAPLFDEAPEASSRIGKAQCAHAYAVSRIGLKLLLSHNHDFTEPVDDFMYNFCSYNLCYYTRHISDEREKLFGKGFFHQDEKCGSDIPK